MKRSPESDLLNVSASAALLAMDAHAVITYRTLGMFGLWPVSPTETTRMWTEKSMAFTNSAVATAFALCRGARPDQVFAAALAPISQTASANAKRLSKGQ